MYGSKFSKNIDAKIRKTHFRRTREQSWHPGPGSRPGAVRGRPGFPRAFDLAPDSPPRIPKIHQDAMAATAPSGFGSACNSYPPALLDGKMEFENKGSCRLAPPTTGVVSVEFRACCPLVFQTTYF
jgi:hypothetical protein